MHVFDPDALLNRTYLTDPDETGQRFRAKIVQKIIEGDEKRELHPDRIKYLVTVEGNKLTRFWLTTT